MELMFANLAIQNVLHAMVLQQIALHVQEILLTHHSVYAHLTAMKTNVTQQLVFAFNVMEIDNSSVIVGVLINLMKIMKVRFVQLAMMFAILALTIKLVKHVTMVEITIKTHNNAHAQEGHQQE